MIESYENMEQEMFSLVSVSFQPLVLSTSLLNCLPALFYFRSHFLYLDLLVFLASLNSCAMFLILRCENTSVARGNLFSPKQVNYSVFLWCFVFFFWTSRIVPSPNPQSYCGENKNWLYKQSLRASHHIVRLVPLNRLGEL